jgi:hypothetical protein
MQILFTYNEEQSLCKCIPSTNLNHIIRKYITSLKFDITKCNLTHLHYTTNEECNLPQILSGASSSSRMGCERKISLDFRQRPRISFSVNWTFLPGRAPRTEKDKIWITSSLTILIWFKKCKSSKCDINYKYGSVQ